MALVVMALSRVVPLSVAQFHVHGLAAVVAMWALAYVVRTNPVPSEARWRAGSYRTMNS